MTLKICCSFLAANNLLFLQDEQSALILLKRHLILKQAVDDYTDSIQQLADRAQKMFAEEHPEGYAQFAQKKNLPYVECC